MEPHFYPTDSLLLDAKGMEIKEVAVMKGAKMVPLKHTYNGMELRITLDKMYKGGEKYIVYINYTSKPNELELAGGAAIQGAKGLYFINPDGSDPKKPTQFWTQGETVATSAWVPIIDKTNQRCTQETYMTVPGNWVTLSNGKLMSSKKNADGTKTDYWKMDLPHAPYLFFVGGGDFAVVKDTYKGKEVNYYVDKEYESVARKIFGNTPEMMAYFSKITGVEYPWVKYGQMVAHDYVSGAMENTTATLHQEGAQQNARELVDGIGWESTIAHELFHQWFGDYVTCENWSNLTVNESFADYSQTLWDEYKYGKDAGDAENYSGLRAYLSNPPEAQKHLVRFYYENPDAMFDLVSYQKGGRILNMLRNFLGDDAFFKGLNNYLVTNKFKTGEAHQLRLALEEVSGRDLNWFFNQWYFGPGHPKLTVDYQFDDAAGKATVIVKQTQAGDKAFILPAAIDVYNGKNKTRHPVWVTSKADTFHFNYTKRPDLVNFDGDKVLLAEKKENGKTLEHYIHQYSAAGNYMDRREAIEFAGKQNTGDEKAAAFLRTALGDRYHGLRNLALTQTKKFLKNDAVKASFESIIRNMAKSDKKSTVRAAAIDLLADFATGSDKDMLTAASRDSSYSVAGAALAALAKMEPGNAYSLAKQFANDARGRLGQAVGKILIEQGTEADFDLVADQYKNLPLTQDKLTTNTPQFCEFLNKVTDLTKVKKGIDLIMDFRKIIPANFRQFTDPMFKTAFKKLNKGKEIEEYIENGMK